MARKRRIHVTGGVYHVIMRGNARQNIFLDTGDRATWQSIVKRTFHSYEHRLHAFCWMTNHVHMAIQAGSTPLGPAMSFLSSQYARRFNFKHRRSGHLFERRYRAILVQQESYLKELIRYIHLNPVRAHMVDTPGKYRWSSHNALLGRHQYEWLTTTYVLAMFGSTRRQARQNYQLFMQEDVAETILKQLRRGSDEDERLLGNDDWLADVMDEEWPGRPQQTLNEIIEKICEAHAVNERALAAPRGPHLHSQIRAQIAVEAAQQGVATISEIARRFNRTQPAISQSIRNFQRKKNL